jgi:hypothetical protein
LEGPLISLWIRKTKELSGIPIFNLCSLNIYNMTTSIPTTEHRSHGTDKALGFKELIF